MVQSVPQVRKDELQHILDSRSTQLSARGSTSCDQLQAETDTMFASSFSDPATGRPDTCRCSSRP
jgi:hypothetical protein